MGQASEHNEDRVTYWGVFEAPVLEAAYRARHAATDQLLGRVIIAAAAVMEVGMSGRDFELFPHGGPELVALTAARWAVFALSILAFALLRRTRSPKRFTAVMVSWLFATAVLPVVIGVLWPPGHIELRMSASLAVLMSYCIMPLSLRFQGLSALWQTVGQLAVIGWLNPLDDPQAILTEAGWLVLINLFGVMLAYRLHSRHRRLYAALQRQSELSSNLAKALAEVRTLRGMIRVCAWCRKVDTGADWEQLEAYVRAHSHAQFTHGICPHCLDQATAGLEPTCTAAS